MHFLQFLREDWGVSLKKHVCGRGKKALKNPFLQNLHRDNRVRMHRAQSLNLSLGALVLPDVNF